MHSTGPLSISLGDFSQVASTKAMAMLSRLVQDEASLHTYHNTFVWVALLSVSGMIPALWMGRQRQRTK
jgi:hypothetical protein